jgi:hypothetical protein
VAWTTREIPFLDGGRRKKRGMKKKENNGFLFLLFSTPIETFFFLGSFSPPFFCLASERFRPAFMGNGCHSRAASSSNDRMWDALFRHDSVDLKKAIEQGADVNSALVSSH